MSTPKCQWPGGKSRWASINLQLCGSPKQPLLGVGVGVSPPSRLSPCTRPQTLGLEIWGPPQGPLTPPPNLLLHRLLGLSFMESLPVQEQSSFAEGRPLFLPPSCSSLAALASLRLLDLNSHHPPPTRDGSQSGRGSRPLPLLQPTAPRRSAAKTGSVEGGGGVPGPGQRWGPLSRDPFQQTGRGRWESESPPGKKRESMPG